jgi:hypothetical protein
MAATRLKSALLFKKKIVVTFLKFLLKPPSSSQAQDHKIEKPLTMLAFTP